MTQAQKCLKWNIKGWWPFFEWPSSGHLLRGWLCISVRAKVKRTFNKALWDTPLWLATALLAVQNITIYHHDCRVRAESRLRCQENWQCLVCVWMCAHMCVGSSPFTESLGWLRYSASGSLYIANCKWTLVCMHGSAQNAPVSSWRKSWLCQLSNTWVIILSITALII